MKKNKMMRLASAMMVMTLMTTSVISGTFAKYVTQETGTDTARVAKWGVEITANGETFASSYKNDDVIGANAVGTVNSVKNGSTDGRNLLAPGTKGTLAACDLSGTPEVAVEVKYEATVSLTGWTVTGDFDKNGNVTAEETNVVYCPIIFNVGGTEIQMDATNDTLAKLEKAVKDAIDACTKDYAVNTDLSDASVTTPDVSWSWPFFVSEVNDIKDTALGDQAADGTASEISVSITTTVTQID